MWSEISVHPERQGLSKKMAPAQRTTVCEKPRRNSKGERI